MSAARYLSSLLLLFAYCCSLGATQGEWTGERPPPFFANGGERPIPRYSPAFSRFTPYSSEDTLPQPVYGRLALPGPENGFKSEPVNKQQPGNFFGGFMPPFIPQGFPEPDNNGPAEFPAPFAGPQSETERPRSQETESRPAFLPPQYRGQRLLPADYFRVAQEGNHALPQQNNAEFPPQRNGNDVAVSKPFFGPIGPFKPVPANAIPNNTASPGAIVAEKEGASPVISISKENTGSEVKLPYDKAHPGRLFEVIPGQGLPEKSFPEQGIPGKGFPEQGFPGQGFNGQGFPGQGFPGQGFPGQGFPGQGQGFPEQGQGFPGQGQGPPGQGQGFPGQGQGQGFPGQGQGQGFPGQGQGQGFPGQGQIPPGQLQRLPLQQGPSGQNEGPQGNRGGPSIDPRTLTLYSPLAGPFPDSNNGPGSRQENQQQGQQQPEQGSGSGSGSGAPSKPPPRILPPSFRSFFPPGFGPFAGNDN